MRYETSGGRHASDLVARLVDDAKRADPLAAVTVVVPSNYAALSLRQALARRSIDGRHGVANVACLTLDQLAAQLAPPSDAAALSPVVLAGAVRAALAADPTSLFAPVAAHRATERALVATYRELSRAHPDTLAALTESPSSRTRAVLDLVGATRRRLARFVDDEQITRRAIAVIARRRLELGLVIATGLDEPSPAQRELLDVLASSGPFAAIDFRFDATVAPLSRVLTASDSDDEVRNVVRHVLALVDDGVPLHRIAIMFTAPEPYARIVREHLAAAGVPHTGPGVRRLADSVTGRLLARLLTLETEGLSRRAVIDLVSSSPRDFPATEWDRLSREAGVLGGADDWSRKLQRYDDDCAALLAQLESDGAAAGQIGRLQRARRDADALAALVARLAGAVTASDALASWAAAVDWSLGQLRELVGCAEAPAAWPRREIAAHRAVYDAMNRLRGLDEIQPYPGFAGFAEAAIAALDDVVDRIGRFGEGVLFMPVALSAGLDVDAVFVVGAAEGLCPLTRREDALLPDRDRLLAVQGELPTRAGRVRSEHQAFLAALSTAARVRVVSYPRGDGRSGRARLPSRWLVRLVSQQLGRPIASTELASLSDPLIESRHSFLDGVRNGVVPASPSDRDLRFLEHHQACGLDVARHHLAQAPDLSRSCALVLARSSPALTRFDGYVGRELSQPVATARALSPSRLERWAGCPMRYFLGDTLQLSEVPRPDDAWSISALDRGTLLHAVLERFVEEQLGATELDYGRLFTLAQSVCDDYEARGLTGRPVLWKLARARLVDDLMRFAAFDVGWRSSGVRTDHVEFSFGFTTPAAEIALDDKRTLRFRGRIDRVDRVGDQAIVFDYKSGGTNDIHKHLARDPVVAGSRLQLPIYAEAVRQRLGVRDVRAFYWFLGAEVPLAGITFDAATESRTREVIAAIVDGVEGGVFPAFPGSWNAHFNSFDNCRHCDFDRLCPRDRDVAWEAKQSDPALEVFVRLGAVLDDTEGDGATGDVAAAVGDDS